MSKSEPELADGPRERRWDRDEIRTAVSTHGDELAVEQHTGRERDRERNETLGAIGNIVAVPSVERDLRASLGHLATPAVQFGLMDPLGTCRRTRD